MMYCSSARIKTLYCPWLVIHHVKPNIKFCMGTNQSDKRYSIDPCHAKSSTWIFFLLKPNSLDNLLLVSGVDTSLITSAATLLKVVRSMESNHILTFLQKPCQHKKGYKWIIQGKVWTSVYKHCDFAWGEW